MVEAVPVRTFAPKQTLLDSLERKVKTREGAATQLAAEAAVTGIDNYFTCVICLGVVEDPKECSACDQLSCESCIATWQKKNDTCPNCRAKLVLSKGVNRFALQTLNSTDFLCETCS